MGLPLAVHRQGWGAAAPRDFARQPQKMNEWDGDNRQQQKSHGLSSMHSALHGQRALRKSIPVYSRLGLVSIMQLLPV